MKKILVGTDTSASADLAVGEAARLAELEGAELLVLHVRGDQAVRDAVDPKKSADPNGYLAAMGRRFPASPSAAGPSLAIRRSAWSRSPSRSASRRSCWGTVGRTDRGGACATACRTSCSGTRPAR